MNIMRSYCSSFYGSQLWDRSNKHIEQLHKSWRKSIRKALNIPLRTPCVYLPMLCQRLPLIVQLEARFVIFFMKGLNSNNSTLCFLMRNATTTGANAKNIMCKYTITENTMHNSAYYRHIANCIRKMYDNNVNSIDAIHASVLLELFTCATIRHNATHCNYEEANDVIDYIALS